MRVCRLFAFLAVFLLICQGVRADDAKIKATFLEIARKGWVFQYNSSIRRRGKDLPEVQINGKSLVYGDICILGDTFHPSTLEIISRFESLLTHVFRRKGLSNFAHSDIEDCGPPSRIYLRVYSGLPPRYAFNQDLARLDEIFRIGFPLGRRYPVMSPAQAATFFGRRGPVAHVLVKQPEGDDVSDLERRFFRSILIEELFQVFTYGLDILVFDPSAIFVSKLQEYPLNLRGLAWDSPRFMKGILKSNPNGLCAFDVFMLHALAEAKLETSNSEAFLSFIETQFGDLLALARDTIEMPEYAGLFDPACLELE